MTRDDVIFIALLLAMVVCPCALYLLTNLEYQQQARKKAFHNSDLTVHSSATAFCEHDLLIMRLAVLLGTGAINHLREMHGRSRTLLFRIANGYKEGKGEMFEIDAGNLLTSHIQGEKLVEGSFNMIIRGRNISRITEILREFGRQSGNGVRMEVLTADFDASTSAIRMATQEAKDNAFGKVDEQVYELAKRYEKDDILFRTELLDCQKMISEIQIDSQLKSKGEYFVGKSYDVHVKSLPVSVIEAHIKVKLSPRQI